MSVSSRRSFVAAALASGLSAGIVRSLRADAPAKSKLPITGDEVPELASFDEMMIQFFEREEAIGAALAVARDGRLVYARGFGLADKAAKEPVQPTSLFRIASISKPITATAVLRLVERNAISLDTKVWELLKLGQPADARWKEVTVLELLQHTGGWDRDVSFDPMFRARRIARSLDVPLPIEPKHVIRYMLDQPLDFDPGSRSSYSNFGYCLLGRVIERVTGAAYDEPVKREVLAPLGIRRTRLGKTLAAQRSLGEVTYYDEKDRTGPSVFTASAERVPWPYGAWSVELMDAHGGWLASAVDLVRFASAFDDPQKCPILRPVSIATMFAPPSGSVGHQADGEIKRAYYGCGWNVRRINPPGRRNTWHTGSLDGTSTILVRRHDGTNWAVLFNTRRGKGGQDLAGLIDREVHVAADKVERWPMKDRFADLL